MIVNTTMLARYGAGRAEIEYFNATYPNGTELVVLLADKEAPKDLLHLCCEKIVFTSIEKGQYYETCGIESSSGLWHCEDVSYSKNIVRSKQVIQSERVFESSEIESCSDIVMSEFVNNSTQIFKSHMVDQSARVLESANISSATNICFSVAIAQSKNVIKSQDVFDSSEIVNCHNITDSFFCADSDGLAHCMFCFGLYSAEYCIFNMRVTKERFELFKRQYKRFMEVELGFVRRGWPQEMAATIVPVIAPPNAWYEAITPKFWKWVETIPGFDAMALYKQTLNAKLILSK